MFRVEQHNRQVTSLTWALIPLWMHLSLNCGADPSQFKRMITTRADRTGAYLRISEDDRASHDLLLAAFPNQKAALARTGLLVKLLEQPGDKVDRRNCRKLVGKQIAFMATGRPGSMTFRFPSARVPVHAVMLIQSPEARRIILTSFVLGTVTRIDMVHRVVYIRAQARNWIPFATG